MFTSRSRHVGFLLVSLSVLFTAWAWGGGRVAPPDDTSGPTGDMSLYLEPIAGLTTRTHLAPTHTAAPVGSVLRFRQALPDGTTVEWIGGVIEIAQNETGSIVECPLAEPGIVSITARVKDAEGRVVRENRCALDVLNIQVSQIQVRGIEAVVGRVKLNSESTNEETMGYYFGNSIAPLVPIRSGNRALHVSEPGEENASSAAKNAVPQYSTSVDRPLRFNVTVDPPGIAPLMEWRVDGQVMDFLGGSHVDNFFSAGRHEISVGPPRRAGRMIIQTYRTEIVSHLRDVDIVPENRSVIFEAVTDPPGFESQIRWLSSTKYGTAEPILGRGRTFTVTFKDTFGDDPNNGLWQWLGVKANNVLFGQDQKPACQPNEDPWSTPDPISEPSFTSSIVFGSADIPPMPADFFGPGSDPFDGEVTLVSTLTDPERAGMTDTKVQRSGPVNFPGVGFPRNSEPVTVQITQLSLLSVDPVPVTFNGGAQSEDFLMAMGLGPSQPVGVLSATLNSANGGTFTTTVPVNPVIAFVSQAAVDALVSNNLPMGETPDSFFASELRILDWKTVNPPVQMGFDPSGPDTPFSTVPPPGGFYNTLELNNAFPFFPGVPAGGIAGTHNFGENDGGIAAAGLSPHIAAGGPGHTHYVCPPPPPPPGLCTYTPLIVFPALWAPVAPPTVKIPIACPVGGAAPCPPGPAAGPPCPFGILVIFPCVGAPGGVGIGIYLLTACCTC